MTFLFPATSAGQALAHRFVTDFMPMPGVHEQIHPIKGCRSWVVFEKFFRCLESLKLGALDPLRVIWIVIRGIRQYRCIIIT